MQVFRIVRSPELDIARRRPVWDAMHQLWLDTDVEPVIDEVARACLASGYRRDELAQIYWNEMLPALSFNLHGPAPEWAGFDLDWLQQRVLMRHRFGKPAPIGWLNPDAAGLWQRLEAALDALQVSAG